MEINKKGTLLGKGKVASVYLYNGYAYKYFSKEFQGKFMDYEVNLNKKLETLPIPIRKFYPSEFPGSIKMDYIEGIDLATSIRNGFSKDEALKDLFRIEKEIHVDCSNIDLFEINDIYQKRLTSLLIDEVKKEKAIRLLDKIPSKNILCHLDFHFLNLIKTKNGYVVIDWPQALKGNPIFDFARTYVIGYEFANRLSSTMLKMIKQDPEIDTTYLNEAIYITILLRLLEEDDKKLYPLLEQYEKMV